MLLHVVVHFPRNKRNKKNIFYVSWVGDFEATKNSLLFCFITHHKKSKRPTNLLSIHHSLHKRPNNQRIYRIFIRHHKKIQQNKNIKLTFYPFFFPFNNSYSNTNLNSHPDYIKIVKKEVTSLPVTVVSVNIDLTPVVVVMLVVNTITVHYLISFTQVISVKLV